MSPNRRTVLAAAAAGLAATSAPATSSPTAPAPRFDFAADPETLALVQRAEQAHAALMRGDIRHYRELNPVADDFMLMSPFGGAPTRRGELSEERWAAVGRFFRNGRDATLQPLQAHRSGDLVVLAAIERAHVEVGGLPAQDWALRVTLVFRKVRGQWLLAHRHADALAGGIGLEEAAQFGRRPLQA